MVNEPLISFLPDSLVQIPFPTYSFDGVDWDWECPSAEDHGGVAADFANTIFLAEPRAVSGTRDITVAMPSSLWYLRKPSFSLDDPSCNEPNGRILASDTATESYDEKAGVKWMHWNKDQWVGYDDGATMQQEMNLASRRCLVGVIKWSVEQDNTGPSMDDMLGISDANGIPNSLKQEYKEKAAVMCRSLTAHGSPSAVQRNSLGEPDEVQTLCCAPGTTMGK
ncbi:hypothetical protein C8035_v001587 [Colletotrichum spinosum]|uniref:Chitinase n=1 Tax=Colletotrichum spinosum TaxID=1347390 RepID=A0A4R8Q0K8_9PEZI|nr:hypothetical protein C8035_v001587 [Colletotrichum spinosum]